MLGDGRGRWVAAWLLVVLSGCGPASSDDPSGAEPDGSQTAAQDAAAEAEPSGGDEPLGELRAEALHDGVTPADPGTAYLEVAGERFDFGEVACSVDDTPGAARLHVDARAEASGEGHRMYLERTIGEDVGWNWENEFVQLARLTPDGEDGAGLFSNSMSQYARDEGAEPEWQQGAGESPLIRIVEDRVTTTGTLEGIPMAPSPLEGEFVAAVTCP